VISESDVERVVKRIVAFHNPEAIYVFGSYAKGTPKESSDLDLVVVERTSLPRRLRGLDVQGVLAEAPFDIDLLFVTPEELAAETGDPWTLLGTVMPTARELYRRMPAGA
jgi:predicted nucleotidyltransferase